MKKIGWLVGCALLLLLMHGSARAQLGGDNDLSRNWNLRAGFFIPEREEARAAEGDVWITFGAERKFYEAERYNATLSIDYYGSGKIYNVPIMLNLRGETNRLRYGVGAGFGISHDLNEGILGFAYNVGVGYTLLQGKNPISFDVRYLGLSTGGGQLNGWQFTLGYQF